LQNSKQVLEEFQELALQTTNGTMYKQVPQSCRATKLLDKYLLMVTSA